MTPAACERVEPDQAVEDPTGREDLVEALRDALLVAMAARLGCNRVARGDCASLAAARTIAVSAKGAGFALPASIQHCDARWGDDTRQPAPVTGLRRKLADGWESLVAVMHITVMRITT